MKLVYFQIVFCVDRQLWVKELIDINGNLLLELEISKTQFN